MNFTTFKKLLINNDIYLFDFNYRKIYYNIILLNKIIKNLEEYVNPLKLITSRNNYRIKLLIRMLDNYNFKTALYICNKKLNI